MNIDLTAPKLQSVPTIQSSFIGVDFSFSVWTGRKKDKDISTALSRANRAKDNTASVTKDLLADNPTLSEIHKFIANVRNEHYSLTQPWSAIRVIKRSANRGIRGSFSRMKLLSTERICASACFW